MILCRQIHDKYKEKKECSYCLYKTHLKHRKEMETYTQIEMICNL